MCIYIYIYIYIHICVCVSVCVSVCVCFCQSNCLAVSVCLSVCEWEVYTSGYSRYKIVFHFKALLWESIILYCHPQLQRLPYCNITVRPVRNIRPPTEFLFSCHTLSNVGEGNIV